MKTFKLMIPLATIVLTIFFAMPSFGEKTTKKELKEDVQEAAETIKKYSVEQRDEAIQSMKSTLDNMDKRIDEMESDLNKKWVYCEDVKLASLTNISLAKFQLWSTFV